MMLSTIPSSVFPGPLLQRSSGRSFGPINTIRRHANKGGGIIVSCMALVRRTIRSSHPTMPGWSTSGFQRPGTHCNGGWRGEGLKGNITCG